MVTGGGGFLGRIVVKQLIASGADVVVLGRRSYPELVKLGAQCFQIDIADLNADHPAFVYVDEVHHCAAVAGIWGEWEDYYATNVKGTENVLAACKKNGVSRLIYTSSPSVVFDGRDQKGVDETQPYPNNWLTHYPHSKMLAEKAVMAANDKDGLRTVCLRPHLIWGPGDQHLIPRIVERARQGKLVQVGTGENWVDVIHVENAAAAHLQAAKALATHSRCAGKAYFVSQGEPVLLWEFINSILKGASLPPVKRRIPFRAAYALGACMEKLYRVLGRRDEPRMTRFLACQLATNHYYDIRSAQLDFGFQPKLSTEQGLNQLFVNDAVQ